MTASDIEVCELVGPADQIDGPSPRLGIVYRPEALQVAAPIELRELEHRAVPGLDGDDGVHQVGVDAVPLGGRGDDAGERQRAGLGRARDDVGGDGDEQQEHEATAEETRRRHGERARYHMRGAGR